MTFAGLAVLVTLGAIPAAYAALRIATIGLRPWASATATARAEVAFLRGIAPMTGSIAVALGIVLPAFLIFEPHHDGERVGPVLILMAALGAAQIVRMVVRLVRMLRLSRHLATAWTIGSHPRPERDWGLPTIAVDAAFPLVAVSGFLRPTLFVDCRVIAACSPAELAAIAAHERAHVRRCDNLRRLLVAICAGPTSLAAAAWREAAEQAADARAADSASRALELAGALLKVARLAPATSLEATALSTIHDGGNLEARIRHLLSCGPCDSASRQTSVARVTLWAALSAAAVATLNWIALLSSVHGILESSVRYLR